GTGLFIGWPLNLVAFILAIVVMARGATIKGLIPLICSLVLSPIIYFASFAVFAALIGGKNYEDYKARVEQVTEAAAEMQGALPDMAVSIDELNEAYDADQASADASYKGKRVMIFGTVQRIDTNVAGGPLVALIDDDADKLVQLRGLPDDQLAGLASGQEISLNCMVQGKVAGYPQLAECTLF
ncbi:MAG: hypothetical protein Q4G62_07360, partial [Pseudomonadota bacterium]|nr:hypothetical protein [Pseudomonadota bacterium]